jgi:cysteine desulfurase / selenocysteine lyase
MKLMPIIKPKILFAPKIINYQVATKKLGRVRYVNLDNAATTPPFSCVQKDVDNYLQSYGSVHRGAGTKSQISTNIYEKSRTVIKKFVGAPPGSYVIFTGNTTGAMNTAAYFFSFLKGKVAVSTIEHSSSWLPWIKAEGIKKLGPNQVNVSAMKKMNERIQKLGRRQVLQYDVNKNFEFDLKSIKKILQRNKIKVFVLTASSNATGYCPDIKKISRLVHKYKAYFVVDACQFIQHHRLNMTELGIDFLAASGHKLYAPFGEGFLIGPKKFLDRLISYEIGGGNLPYITKKGKFLRYQNQLSHDPGTPNAVGAIAIMSALKRLTKLGLKNVEKYESNLATKAFENLQKNKKVKIYVKANHLNTVIPFNIIGQNPREVATALNDQFGIGVRAGSFCVYNVVRNLMNIKDETQIIEDIKNRKPNSVPGFVRASFSLCNNLDDVNRFVYAINEITKK